MKNILLPTDFSENSRNAIQYALEYFKGQKCNFYFLNVQKVSEFTTDDFYTASPNKSIYDTIIDDNKQMLTVFVNEYEKHFGNKDFSFHSMIDYDVFTDAINQAVEANNIDLIIMGTNGATGAKEVLFGSNTLKVIRQVNCALIAIPEGFIFKEINSILFTIHYGEVINSEKLIPLQKMIEHQKSSLKILEIKEKENGVDSRNDTLQKMKELFSKVKIDFYREVGIPTPIAVNSFVQIMDVDMHATFIERKAFLKRFIFGSEDSKISYGTKIPLLIMHKE